MISETDLTDYARGDVRPTSADGQEMAREILRLREALDVIATCPAEAVHLMPLAAQAALSGCAGT
jgi:hypothetical protein